MLTGVLSARTAVTVTSFADMVKLAEAAVAPEFSTEDVMSAPLAVLMIFQLENSLPLSVILIDKPTVAPA